MISLSSGVLSSFIKNKVIFDADAKWCWHLSCESLEVQGGGPGLQFSYRRKRKREGMREKVGEERNELERGRKKRKKMKRWKRK